MRPTHTVDSILGTRSKVAVLRVLRGVRIPLNASQIAARTGLTRPAITSVLRDFAEMGIVRSSSAGRANIHSLERANIYVEQLIEPLFAAEEHIPDEMIDELRRKFEPFAASIVLFGSYSRWAQGSSSDVDLALVSADHSSKAALEQRVDTYALEFRTRFAATLSPLVYDAAEAAALRETAPSLAQDLERDGLVISGISPRDWPTHG